MSIDSILKWDEHINIMIPKMPHKTGILTFLCKLVPIHALMHLYNTTVQQNFNYGDLIYFSASTTNKT